jgi:hypothetical protein
MHSRALGWPKALLGVSYLGNDKSSSKQAMNGFRLYAESGGCHARHEPSDDATGGCDELKYVLRPSQSDQTHRQSEATTCDHRL